VIKKFPSVWEKISENRIGDFLTHTVHLTRSEAWDVEFSTVKEEHAAPYEKRTS